MDGICSVSEKGLQPWWEAPSGLRTWGSVVYSLVFLDGTGKPSSGWEVRVRRVAGF